ncbi:MAG: ABC transporter ATP-binding protein, partial [Devosia sp.]
MTYLEIDKLNSCYGDSHVLFDVSMHVEQKEVVA